MNTTINLSKKSAVYLSGTLGDLENGKGGPATESEKINVSLETLAAFEAATGTTLQLWVLQFKKVKNKKLRKSLANPGS